MEWPNRVFAITGPPGNDKAFGTGFAVAWDADDLLLVTCWHVVDGIGQDRLHLDRHWPCELVSEPGDHDLDLAVLRVRNPASQSGSQLGSQPDLPKFPLAEPFAVAATGYRGQPFETFGYEPVGRPLSGRLGANTSRPHASHRPVPAWDYYLEDEGHTLEKIKDGYSGAPVYDPESGAVLAVITHRQGADKGFAIDIGNLPRVYSEAAAWLRPPNSAADNDHEYLTDDAVALATRLDHQEQRKYIKDLLDRPGVDRAIALVECGPRDWPQDLANHIQTEHDDSDHAVLTPAILLNLGLRTDAGAIWAALVEVTPGAAHQPDPQAAVRDHLCSRRVTVLYVPVKIKDYGRHLPEIIRGVQADLEALGDLADARILVLIAGIRSDHRLHIRWRWQILPRIKRLGFCHALLPMRALESADLDDWYNDFPRPLLKRYRPDRLKAELLALFDKKWARVDHNRARCLLVGCAEGTTALDRARR